MKHKIKFICVGLWLPVRVFIQPFPKNKFLDKVIDYISSHLEPYLLDKVANKVDKTHICVHAHANNSWGDYIDKKTGMNVPKTLELTFLRRDRFHGNESEYINPSIPHPLDIVNISEKPPLILNSKWHSLKM